MKKPAIRWSLDFPTVFGRPDRRLFLNLLRQNVNKNRFHCLIECHINTVIYKQKRNNIVYLLSYKLGKTAGSLRASHLAISSTCGHLFDSYFVGQGEGLKLWQKLNKVIQTTECEIILIGAIQLTKRMQIFFDTGAKFHEFLLRCGIAEESLIVQQSLNEAEQDIKNSANRGGCYRPRWITPSEICRIPHLLQQPNSIIALICRFSQG